METVRSQTVSEATAAAVAAAQLDPRAAKILARTMYKDMVGHGLSPEQILGVASELIAQVTAELKHVHDDAEGRA